ncbi:hypothetical protein KAH27_10525 [bacterium]|nr:hypothetical protein [bacterium]
MIQSIILSLLIVSVFLISCSNKKIEADVKPDTSLKELKLIFPDTICGKGKKSKFSSVLKENTLTV